MKIRLLSVMLLVYSMALSQTTPFQRFYPSQYGFVGKLLTPTLDNGYFFLHQEAYGYITHFVKTDATGEVQWSVDLNMRHVQDILPEADGSYMIIGPKHVIRMNSTGQILWQYLYKYEDIRFYKIKKDVRGDGYLILAAIDRSVILLKIDDTGSVIWMQRMGNNKVPLACDLVQSEADFCTYVVSLVVTLDDSYVLITKFTEDGKGIWAKEFSRIPGLLSIDDATIKKTVQDRFLIGVSGKNQLKLIQVDTSGTIVAPVQKLTHPSRCIWQWELADPGQNNGILFSILMEPFVLHPVSRHVIAGKTNANGTVSWVKQLGVKNREHVEDINAEGSYITILAVNHDTLTNTSYVKLIKSNASHTFCDEKYIPYPVVSYTSDTTKLDTVKFDSGIITRIQTTDLVTGFLNTPSYLACYESELSDINSIAIYPNPFDWQTTIAFENVQYQSKIQLFNGMGDLILEQEFTGKQLTLQQPGLTKGIYFFRVTDKENHSICKKVMVQ